MQTPATATEPAATTVVIRDYFDVVVPIDDVTGEAVIPLRIRRFNRAQMEAFTLGWTSILNPPSNRELYRLQTAEEQEKNEQGQFVIPDAEITRRRVAEMSTEQRAVREAQLVVEFQELIAFTVAQITSHVWVAPVDAEGRPVRVQRVDEDGQVLLVRTGADVAALFSGNGEMLGRIVRHIHDQNSLTPEKKRLSKLFSASIDSSLERQMAAAGRPPAGTAADVVPPDSAATAPASAPRAPRRSGRMRG